MHAGISGVQTGGGGKVCREEVVRDWWREAEVLTACTFHATEQGVFL